MTDSWSTQQLVEFLAVVSSAPDERSAMRAAAERAAEALEAEVGAVLLAGEVVTSVGFPRDRLPGGGVVLTACATGRLDVEGVGSCVVCGAGCGRDGTDMRLVVARHDDEGFTQQEANLVRGMARMLGMTTASLSLLENEQRLREASDRQALENARLADSLRDRQALSDRLARIERSISHRAPLAVVLQAIVGGAHELIGDEVVGLRLVDADDPTTMTLVATIGIEPDLVSRVRRTEVGVGPAGRAVLEDRIVVTERYAEDLDAAPEFVERGLQSAMAAPVREGSRVVGSLSVATYRPGHRYSVEEQEILQALAAHASLALADSRAVQELADANARLEEAQALARIGSWHVNLETGVLTWSEEMYRIFGLSSRMPLTMDDFRARVVAEDYDRLMRRDTAGTVLPESTETQYRIVRADGETRVLRGRLRTIRNEDGKPVELTGYAKDVTESILADQALRDAYERERQAAEHLRSLGELKNAILSAVSHELRTPLTVVLGLAQTLRAREHEMGSEQRLQLLERLARNGERLETILSDLLDLDRLTRGIIDANRERTDVGRLVRRVVRDSGIAEVRRVGLDLQQVVADIDARKVERIVENLLTNAARHTPAESAISIRVRGTGHAVRIVVEDDGPGVPDELREEIFQPFRQGPTALPHSPGIGVGLSLVARFAELHGGRAWVDARPEGGAAFTVELPSTVVDIRSRRAPRARRAHPGR